MTKKRILTGLRLDKIAAVDRPCQEHATMTIMKRADNRLGPDDVAALIQKQAEQIVANDAALESLRAKESKKMETDFEAIVVDITKRDKVGRAEALRKARVEHPIEFENFQTDGQKRYDDAVAKAHQDRGRGAPGQEFLRKVAQIEAGGNVGHSDALRKARQLYPEEFKAYNGEAA